MIHQLDTTIVAIATPSGQGAIGIIRLSGSEAIPIADKLFSGKKLKEQLSHTLHFGTIKDDEEIIDEVIISLYKAPKSYTGDDVVEISCHGSDYILQRVLSLCISSGATLAKAGEFTQRAFLNGKMDLTQAEAVADLIASENKAAHDLAINQMRGGVSSELVRLREQLVNFTALIELELDFSEEDVEFADRKELETLVRNLKSKIQHLIESFEYGNAIKSGVPVAIIGKPNTGKSTLLNALLKEERAIVSDIAGTTRDVIEETMTLDGIRFRFIDTAGIRDTEDVIEAIGVQRAKEKMRQAKVIIHLYNHEDLVFEELQKELDDKIVFSFRSKSDERTEENIFLPVDKNERFYRSHISVKTGHNMKWLKKMLVAHYKNEETEQSVVITNVRHKEALEKTLKALIEVEEGLSIGLSGDLLSYPLKDALYHLGTITGKVDVDKDILGTIFGKFCIGK